MVGRWYAVWDVGDDEGEQTMGMEIKIKRKITWMDKCWKIMGRVRREAVVRVERGG